MGDVIRPIDQAEFPDFVRAIEQGAGRELTEDAVAAASAAYPLSRILVACSEGVIVGGTASDSLELTVCGPSVVPVARATLTALLPTHRGRGLATRLLIRQMAELRQSGEALVIATTSAPGLIANIGYAPASRALAFEVRPRDVILLNGDVPGTIRMLSRRDVPIELPPLFERHRITRPGQVNRPMGFWQEWFVDRPLYRIGEGPRFAVVYDDASGSPQGYLTYRLSPADLRDQPVGEFVVEDLIAVTDESWRALWSYAATFTQARLVRALNVPTDEPLRWLLRDPKYLRVTQVRDFLWLRVLDVAAALAARGYGAEDHLVLEVEDSHLVGNGGRYALTAEFSRAECVRSTEHAELSLDVAALAAAYLGGTSFTALARAGRVRECKSGAIQRADALFASSPHPWTVTDW